MSRAVAFLAGLGAGYFGSERQKEEQAARDRRDAREQAKFDAEMADRAQSKADKDALRAAAAPVTVEAGDEFKPSKDMPVPTGDYKVGAARFASEGAANDAANAANAPGAVRKRVMATMAAQGNVLGSDQLRTSGLQADAAQGQLDEQHHLQQAREFARGVAGSLAKGGWSGFAKFATDNYNDDNNYEAVEDGKGGAIIIAKGKDGKEIGRQSFSTPEEAIMFSVGRADPTKWAEYKANRDDKKEAQANSKRQLDIAQQNANTNEQFRRDQAANMAEQRRIEAERIKALTDKASAPGAPLQLTLKDKRDFESDLSGYIKDQFPAKEGSTPEERAAMVAQANQVRALGSTLFENNAAIGIPLTAGTVAQAMQLASDPKNLRVFQVGGQAYKGVIVNGQPVITSGAVQPKAAAAPTAQSPVAAQARQGVAPTAAAPQAPAAPQQPAIPPEKVAVMAPFNDAVIQAAQQMAAVARSGDQQAIATYSAKLEQARAARLKAAQYQFGPTEGQQYVASLPQ